jgi:myo-inositol 2-dehydrogenase/D-chiro-inositol 1-dehydrogenase
MSEQGELDNRRGTTRRRFLKDSAMLASGAALGTLALSRSVHAAGEGTIKIGMIGAGGRCSGAAAESMQASPDVKLVAICDLFEDRVKGARDNLKTQAPNQVVVDDDHCFAGFDGYQKVIDSADAVMIACASKFHPMYAEAAIKAGKHVFVEKPHAIDPVGVRRMAAVCDLAKTKGLSILSGLQSRFDNGWQETVQRIHDGAIGDIVAMQSMFLRGPYRLEARQPNATEMQFQYRNWYHFLWLSGDDVPQSLVHNIDRMCWILGEKSPEWAFGLGGRSASFGEVYGDMFDHHTVVYEYKDGPRLYALCRTQANCYGNGGDIVMGAKGKCDLANCRITGETNWQFDKERKNPYVAEQAAFVEAIQSGKPINSGYHMLNATMIGVMGQIACYSGQPVRYDEASKADLQFGPSPDEANFETPPPSVPDATGNYPLPMPGITQLL